MIFIPFIPKWRFKKYPHIQISKDLIIYNIKTERKKKICYNGGSLGVWITPKKFIIKRKINNHIELIPKYEYIEGDFLTNL